MTSRDRRWMITTIIRAVMSVVFIVIGIWLITKGGKLANTGSGMLGMVLGYWLK